MSPPAENALPSPVMTHTAISGSSSSAAMTAGSSRKKARFIALSFSGRRMVTSAVPSLRRSTARVSRSIGRPASVRLRGHGPDRDREDEQQDRRQAHHGRAEGAGSAPAAPGGPPGEDRRDDDQH